MALTVGVATVLDSREVVVIVTGLKKSLALSKAIEGGVNHLYTLSALQMHPWALIVVDEDATSGMPPLDIPFCRPPKPQNSTSKPSNTSKVDRACPR
ncbi:hypothetical protein PILCRDRAFT_824731 [Piloderma croceum F 1598]|uniref:Glucosamine-6-phosphate deaminase n=1 Tax=Piloderma croceum (strain F 1598) TaxID=765440 RepID=A0A0C3FEE7_PILCF|nr:hypothetical protein PILCRDRAFT_828650 [Piloderma croceum F 1598]KIM78246.1 hypothetical protein PILCRDRAFT_824731 [Piloderma croceum F 1598]